MKLLKRLLYIFTFFSLISCVNDRELTISENLNLNVESISENDTQSSVFITRVEVDVDPDLIKNVRFTVKNKKSAVSDEISAIFSRDKVENGKNISVPIFGLYDNYMNLVEILLIFIDNSTSKINIDIETQAYDNPHLINTDLIIEQPPNQNNKPSFSFFLLQPNTGLFDNGNNGNSFSSIIMDIDGNIRWVRNSVPSGPYTKVSRAAAFINNKIIHMDPNTNSGSPNLLMFDLTGTSQIIPISNTNYLLDNVLWPHHNIQNGKSGIFIEVNANDQIRGTLIGQVLIELNDAGQVIKEFDFGAILAKHMLANGDDSTALIRHPVNWFHGNSTIYDSRDNSVITSSRENFVMKIGYDDKEIKWIFGDPNKHWYVNFPSLRKLSLSTDSEYPIGQHSLSIDGEALMLYNNGTNSFRNPENTPPGINPSRSLASKYIIDISKKSATMIWNYDPNLYSPVCSSIFRDTANGDYLINHSSVGLVIGGGPNQSTDQIFEGINENKEILFKFTVNSRPCVMSWNTKIIDLNNLEYN